MQEAILLFFQNHANPFFDLVANVCSFFGEQTIVIIVMVAILWCYDKKKGFAICSALLSSLISMGILKAIVRAPRPFTVLPSIAGKRLATATGYSFPSGHTTTAASFYSALAMAFKKRTISIFCAILIVLVGISRLYLGVHWPIDIFGGLILGTSISLLCYAEFENLYENKDKRYSISLVVGILAFVSSLTMALLLHFESIDTVAFTDLMKTLALGGGGYLGFALEVRKVNYSIEGSVGRKLIRFLVGLAGILLIMALKLAIPTSVYYLGSLVRYTLIGLWATGLYPLIGKSLF
ncbi:phosphatase PAP2 family protein [uncultured Sphaerochaeta sp.]|uniref:phosphatase PAP2 family protein n=1 Tax=uncultured Sphaerochaeta sp. TaxID=886478 RepID=UPI002A0A0EC5|nr:phosphatase PAP2 family protein [uncultured Sphaerochaeta sp.]